MLNTVVGHYCALDYVTIHCFSFKFEHIGEFVLYLNMIKESNPIGVLLEGDL